MRIVLKVEQERVCVCELVLCAGVQSSDRGLSDQALLVFQPLCKIGQRAVGGLSTTVQNRATGGGGGDAAWTGRWKIAKHTAAIAGATETTSVYPSATVRRASTMTHPKLTPAQQEPPPVHAPGWGLAPHLPHTM
eukprot:366258-Chlamydomonas_euryale.AAC.5